MSLTRKFADFLDASPTPYHACANLSLLFAAEGFTRLDENTRWQLEPGKKYFFTRGDSSFAAFVVGERPLEETGVRIIGAHTDSPCLKIKPNADKVTKGYHQLGVAVYGGALLAPWFDRDLSIAGRVTYLDGDGALKAALVNFGRAIALIPSLAIHLDRSANEGRAINPQTQMNAILQHAPADARFADILLNELQQAHPEAVEVLDYNLSFYDTQPSATVGLKDELFVGARLDNLASCFLGAEAMLNANTDVTSILICNDHEEIGSNTDLGAQGPMLGELIDRLVSGDAQSRQLTLRRSLMLSVDNAHGVHPNFADKHDDKHGPLLNAGPVVKFDANQSYATGADTAAVVRWLARAVEGREAIPLQSFIMRADMRCGSTIGPITSAEIGVRAVDLGIPTFGMHSIRETAGVSDLEQMASLLTRFVSVTDISL
ncbi:M18 family aminopeptidase [Teredinibacter turnerae]|uniref:M18 family aminopeptidase n=1 Tax=Teredinibacter turnerae TaxID=2426 RepID=UPI00036E30BA|nr:M18 family aminopeptidase [Teredinibacter turnerae]